MGPKLLLAAAALVGLVSASVAGPAPIRVELSDSCWVDVKPQVFAERDSLAWVFASLRWSSVRPPVVSRLQVAFIWDGISWMSSRADETPVPASWKKIPNRRLFALGFVPFGWDGRPFMDQEPDSMWIDGVRP